MTSASASPDRPPPPAAAPEPAWPGRDAGHLLVTGAEMAALEEELFRSGLPVEALMEKAALAVTARLLEQHGPRLRQHGAVVLVGPGHNGGDGLVVARELHLAGITVAIWSPFSRHKPLTASHRRHALWLGIPELPAPPDPGQAALWVDALLGIGQSRPLADALQMLLAERQRRCPGALVAIDVPSGLCADSGRLLGSAAARASHTYCLGLHKQGLLQDGALAWVGRLERLDLGLPAALLARLPAGQPLALFGRDLATAPWPQPSPDAGKYGRGRLLLVAGSARYRGAASLALAGADASGCGSLRAALPEPVAEALWATAPHVVVQRSLTSSADGSLQLAGLEAGDLARLDAVLLGPGLGHGQPGSPADDGEAWSLLQEWPGLLVLDADGLNRLALRPAGACTWLRQRRGPTWLTPHRGEFARLFPDLGQERPLVAATRAAERCGAAVLLKGARTVVASPDGRCWQLAAAAGEAARAGLGDVLAGYAAGVGAQAPGGDPALLAAVALAHAEAGRQLAARGTGSASPMAVAAALAATARPVWTPTP